MENDSFLFFPSGLSISVLKKISRLLTYLIVLINIFIYHNLCNAVEGKTIHVFGNDFNLFPYIKK